MRIRRWQYPPILCFLLLVGVSLPCAVSTWAPTQPAFLSSPRSMPAAAVPTRIDFDDDQISDLLTFSDREGHPDIEIYLSATQTMLTLPVDAVADDTGSLAVRDLDSDGDEDL